MQKAGTKSFWLEANSSAFFRYKSKGRPRFSLRPNKRLLSFTFSTTLSLSLSLSLYLYFLFSALCGSTFTNHSSNFHYSSAAFTMGRTPCCNKNDLKKGPWTPEEDLMLINYIHTHGPGNWRTLPKNAGAYKIFPFLCASWYYYTFINYRILTICWLITFTGLKRCGKSCRLRWTNYLRPDIKRGRFSFEEEETIIQLHSIMGNKYVFGFA